jgi:NADH-quinone oxidoreductase subunit G
MANAITLTIDGKTVTVPAGTLIVDAAREIGIDIPVFCYHPKMEPVGMCRMCLVEVGRPMVDRATNQPVLDADGTPKLQFGPKLETACTTPVSAGMVVIGMSDKVKTARNDVLEFLLTSHPLDCPICDKGGECPLQNLTIDFGKGTSRFDFDDKKHNQKHVPLGDLIYLDRERCIQCGRCVRFQKDLADDPVIGFYQRGRNLVIDTSSEPGFDSIFSGNTTDICPVGALTTADFRFGARPWELKSAASLCNHCAVGCNLTYNTRREAKSDGKVVIKRAMPRQNEAVNEIWLCDKGRFGYHFVESRHRLDKPLIRKDGELVESTWDEALDLAAKELRAYGFRFVSLASGRLSNEDLYEIKQLTENLHGQACLYSPMAAGDLTPSIGYANPQGLSRVGKGTVIVVAASNLHQEAPIWWMQVRAAVKRGAQLIVVNARATRLDKFASAVVRYRYGREAEAVLSIVPGAESAGESGKTIAAAENLIVLYGSDGLGLDGSAQVAAACAELLRASNLLGKPGSGLLPVWQRANDQGAWDTGFNPVADLAQVVSTADGVLIAGADPAGDEPALAAALKKAKFVIVQEEFLTKTAQLADIVFPVQAMLERDGSYTNGMRRVQRFMPVVEKLPGTRPDYLATAQLRQKVVHSNLEYVTAAQVFMVLAAHLPDYQNLNYATLMETAPQHPLLGRSDVYYGGTSFENSQGLGVQLSTAANRREAYKLPAAPTAQNDLPDLEHAEELMAVPVAELLDTGTITQKSALLGKRTNLPFALLHPKTAQQKGLTVGEKAKVSLSGANYQVVIKVDDSVPTLHVLLPRSLGIPLEKPALVKVTQ